MEIFQIGKEKLGLDTKRYTTCFILCFIILPVSIMVAMLFRNSTFDLGRVFGGTAQNSETLRYDSRNDSYGPATSPDSLDSRIGEGPDSRNVSFEPSEAPDSRNVSFEPSSHPNDRAFAGTSRTEADSHPDDKAFAGNFRMEPDSHPDDGNSRIEPASMPEDKVLNGTSNPEDNNESGSGNDSSQPDNGKFLDALFSPGLDERSCRSRYEASLYRKSSHKPSPFLLSRLREYENLHKHCGPNTKSYKKALKRLAKNSASKSTACKYIVWIPANGLGNRMISMAATFLYALLTNRVLLVDHGTDMTDLFCEPFPDTSWLLPHNFPLKNHLKLRYARSFGSIVNMSMDSWPSYLYLNLDRSNYYQDKKLFYCEKTEALLAKMNWVIMLSDQYFVPYFFMSQTYKEEVGKLFPEKDTVFYHLGRYLFNPTNQAWGLITRFYDGYLANADQRVGLQLRVYNPKTTPLQTVLDQLLECTQKEKVLPEVEETQGFIDYQSKNKTSKAILVTSLHYEFYEKLSHMYWTRPTVTGEAIGVYQPSHEQYQHFGDNMHNMKAWAEIYLLSLTDVVVTSSWSTFGYVAQGLGGLKPWIMYKTDDKNVRIPPCIRDLSMEPCFHFPPTHDCHENKVDAGSLAPHLAHCLDFVRGVKLLLHHVEL